MRAYIMLTVIGCGLLWVFDVFAYDGHHNQAVWQDGNAVWRHVREDGQDFTYAVQRRLDKLMSGH